MFAADAEEFEQAQGCDAASMTAPADDAVNYDAEDDVEDYGRRCQKSPQRAVRLEEQHHFTVITTEFAANSHFTNKIASDIDVDNNRCLGVTESDVRQISNSHSEIEPAGNPHLQDGPASARDPAGYEDDAVSAIEQTGLENNGTYTSQPNTVHEQCENSNLEITAREENEKNAPEIDFDSETNVNEDQESEETQETAELENEAEKNENEEKLDIDTKHDKVDDEEIHEQSSPLQRVNDSEIENNTHSDTPSGSSAAVAVSSVLLENQIFATIVAPETCKESQYEEWSKSLLASFEDAVHTSEISMPWPQFRDMALSRFNFIITSDYWAKESIGENQKSINDEIEKISSRIKRFILAMHGPPFTLQRLCELLLYFVKGEYKTLIKYLRGVERVVCVSPVSNVPFTVDDSSFSNLQTNSKLSESIDFDDGVIACMPPRPAV